MVGVEAAGCVFRHQMLRLGLPRLLGGTCFSSPLPVAIQGDTAPLPWP
jgi:hypothetical protein